MKYIRSIIQKWVKHEKKVLGRWNIDYCDKVIDNKIDLSNEDHCGPCGQYILVKTNTPEHTKSTVKYTNIPVKSVNIPIEYTDLQIKSSNQKWK